MNQESSLQEKIKTLQDQYYKENAKNIIFKSSQKLDCAKRITQQIPLETLLDKTFVLDDHSNKIYGDYTIFKTFANPSNYEAIIQYCIKQAREKGEKYGSYEVHVNMDTFTITAAQRHSEIIKVFCAKCLKKDAVLYKYLDKLYLYKYPSMIHTIHKLFSPFMDKDAMQKIVLVDEHT
jgi:hypothetical protein